MFNVFDVCNSLSEVLFFTFFHYKIRKVVNRFHYMQASKKLKTPILQKWMEPIKSSRFPFLIYKNKGRRRRKKQRKERLWHTCDDQIKQKCVRVKSDHHSDVSCKLRLFIHWSSHWSVVYAVTIEACNWYLYKGGGGVGIFIVLDILFDH